MPTEKPSKLECLEKNAVVNGIRLTYFERGMAHRGTSPTLLFVHATGFHARIWDKIINQLGNIHSISVDQRGHGRSEKKKIDHWENVISDIHELVEQLDLQNVIAIGHSMGAHALIGTAARSEERFLEVIAIDPVIPPEEAFEAGEMHGFEQSEDHPTAKRRNEFDSPEEMAERLKGKGSFGLFDPEMLKDYCVHGLLPNEKGKGYVLACPPAIEASVYMSSRSNHDIYSAVRSLSIPVLILRAKEPDPDRNIMDFSSSPTWPGLVDEFSNGREIHFSELTHFLPMQIPDQITEIISEEIKNASKTGE